MPLSDRPRRGLLGGLALALAAGVVMVAAFPPWEIWPAAWIAPALLLVALRHVPRGYGFAVGLTTGVVFQSLLGWWLLPAGVNPLAYAAGALACGAWLGLFGAGTKWLELRSPALALLGIPCLFGVLEWGRANVGWLAAPWGVLGGTQLALPPVAGIAALAGVWGVSWLLASAAVIFAALVDTPRDARVQRSRRTCVGLLALLCFLLLTTAWVLRERGPIEGGKTLRVAIVQAGRFQPASEGAAQARQVFERYARLSRESAGSAPQLIVWPEASMPATLPSDRVARSALASLARELRVHLLIASSGRDKSKPSGNQGEWANSVFLFSPDGEIGGRYDKVRLLPFNEYVPLRGLLRWPGWIAPEMVDARAGQQRTAFDVEGFRFGVLICWENLFASEFRAAAAPPADFMVSLTNESFAPVGPGREQLLALNAMRALENGLFVVRAATTGISAFVAPDGAILERVADEDGRDRDVTGFRVFDVPAGRSTPYRRYGDWIVALEAAILLGVGAAGLREVGAR